MAIDPKELRLGSHVEYKDYRCVVVAIADLTSALRSGVALKVDSEVMLNADPNLIAPIPITSELLTELGFECKDKIYWEHWFKGGFDIERDKDSKYFDYSSELRIEYLHELENLYYMIYGVELITD